MCLMVEVKSNAVKKNTRQEPGMLGPWIKVNWNWSNSSVQNWNHTDYILCSQRKRTSIQSAKTRLELTVTQVMNSLLQNSNLKKSREHHLTTQIWHKSNSLWLYSVSDKQMQGIRSDRQSAWITMDGGVTLYRRQWLKACSEKEMQEGKHGCQRRPYT